MFAHVIGYTQCIQSSTCLIQKYPVSYVTLGHCAVFAHVCMHAMVSNTVLNKSILPSTCLIMNYYIVRTFKYTVHNDYRNKRSCTVHQSTNIQILKVFLSGMNKVTYFQNKYNSWQRKHAKLLLFFFTLSYKNIVLLTHFKDYDRNKATYPVPF